MAPTRGARIFQHMNKPMSPRIRAKNIAILEGIVANASRPEALRRSAALRLSRLKGAVSPTTTRTTPKPAPLPVPTDKARFEALESFLALSRHRTALFRKRRTAGEQDIFNAMVALMPATVPPTDDPQQWRDFIARVSAILEEIKSTK